MLVDVIGESGKSDSLEISAQVFDSPFNSDILHQVVVAYQSNGRHRIKSGKNRSAVSGGGRKPWRQKGSGRARAGTIRSPLWRGGGVTFASGKPNYDKKINRKMYQNAMRSVFSELLRQQRLLVVDEVKLPEPKTAQMVAWLVARSIDQDVVLLLAEHNQNVELASRNLPRVQVNASGLLPLTALLSCQQVVVEVPKMKALQEWLG